MLICSRWARPAADRDVEECERLAKAAGADRGTGRAGEVATGTAVGAGVGAAGGAVGGADARPAPDRAIGAATGAVVGFLTSIFRRRPAPGPAYANFVDRCLREKGCEPTGGQ